MLDVEVSLGREVRLGYGGSVEAEVHLARTSPDWTLLQCRAVTSAVVVSTSGLHTAFCPHSTLRWRANPFTQSIPPSYNAAACLKQGLRPCKQRELCEKDFHISHEPNYTTADILVATSEGSTVRKRSGTTLCTVEENPLSDRNFSREYAQHCCAEDVCTEAGGGVVIPPGQMSSFPSLLRLAWSRKGRGRVLCDVISGEVVHSTLAFNIISEGKKEGSNVAVVTSPVQLLPNAENAVLEVFLKRAPEGSNVVRCHTETAGTVAATPLVFTQRDFDFAQKLSLRWEVQKGVTPQASTERVFCSVDGAPAESVGEVQRRVGPALRFVDAEGGALGEKIVLGADEAVAGFGVEVSYHVESGFAVNPDTWPNSLHELGCELFPPDTTQLQMLAPVPLSFNTSRTFWFLLKRARRQLAQYSVTLRCRNIQMPHTGIGTLWSLHPDYEKGQIHREVVVRVPTVARQTAQFSLTSSGAFVSGRSSEVVATMGVSVIDTLPFRVTCHEEGGDSTHTLKVTPQATTFEAAVNAHNVPETSDLPLLTGSLIALQYAGRPFAYDGAKWLSCVGSAACRLSSCAGANMEGGEWEVCKNQVFQIYAGSPSDDRYAPLVQRSTYVFNGDLIVLANTKDQNVTFGCGGSDTDVCQNRASLDCLSGLSVKDSLFSQCNSTFRIWADGKRLGEKVFLSDSVALQWSEATEVVQTRWLGCAPQASSGDPLCTATYYDTCPGTPDHNKFVLSDACSQYRFTIAAFKASPQPSDHPLQALSLEVQPAGSVEAAEWFDVPSTASSIDVAFSGQSASLHIQSFVTNKSGTEFINSQINLNVDVDGSIGLESANKSWVSARGVYCTDDYITLEANLSSCQAACENTTGCGYVSYPHYDGCRMHAGVLKRCFDTATRNATSATMSATLVVEPAQNTALFHPKKHHVDGTLWNGAASIGNGSAIYSSPLSMVPFFSNMFSGADTDYGLTFDLQLRRQHHLPSRFLRLHENSEICLGAGGLGVCNDTTTGATSILSVQEVGEGRVRLRFVTAVDGSVDVISTLSCLPLSDTLCNTPLEFARSDENRYLVLIPDTPLCLALNGTAVSYYDSDGANTASSSCGAFYTTDVIPTYPDTPLALTRPSAGSGVGLSISYSGNITFEITDTSGETAKIISDILPFGTWHHIAGVLDMSRARAKLYINGRIVGTVGLSGLSPGLSTQEGTVFIGSPSTGFSVLVDNVAVWDYVVPPDVLLQRMACESNIHTGNRMKANPKVSLTFTHRALTDAYGGDIRFTGDVISTSEGLSCDAYLHIPDYQCLGLSQTLPDATKGECEVACNANTACTAFTYTTSIQERYNVFQEDIQYCSLHIAEAWGTPFVVELEIFTKTYQFVEELTRRVSVDCYRRPALLQRAPGVVRIESDHIPSCEASSYSALNSTCSGVLESYHYATGTGEWASNNEGVGAWVVYTLDAVHIVHYLRIAQRGAGALQIRTLRVCATTTTCMEISLPESHTQTFPYSNPWTEIPLPKIETERIHIEITSVFPSAVTTITNSCSKYKCPGVTFLRNGAVCTGECTTIQCCDNAGGGFQGLELYGTALKSQHGVADGVLGEWCAPSLSVSSEALFDNFGVLGVSMDATTGRPYDTLQNQYCNGEEVLQWSNGGMSLFGTSIGSVAECKATCDAHPLDCRAFDYVETTESCYWRRTAGVGNYSMTHHSACMVPDSRFVPGNGSVVQEFTHDARFVGNVSSCHFTSGSLSVPHFPTPEPLSIFSWVQLYGDACNSSTYGAPIVSWSSYEGAENLFFISYDRLGWIANGSRIEGNQTTICDGAWHAVAVTVSLEGEVAFYVDGVEAGGGCCVGSPYDTDVLTIGSRAEYGVVVDTLDGRLFGTQVAVRHSEHAVQHEAYHEWYNPSATISVPFSQTFSFARLTRTVGTYFYSDTTTLISFYNKIPVSICKEYCGNEPSCVAFGFATERSTPGGKNVTGPACFLFSSTVHADAGGDLMNFDFYIRAASPVRQSCSSHIVRTSADLVVKRNAAFSVYPNETNLVLADADAAGGESVAFLHFDVASEGIERDEVSSVHLTMQRSGGLLVYYPLDFSTVDRSFRTQPAILGQYVSFSDDCVVEGCAEFSPIGDSCAAIVGGTIEDFLDGTNTTSFGVFAWVYPRHRSEGGVFQVDNVVSIYFEKRQVYCKVMTSNGWEYVKTNSAVLKQNEFQHIGCQYSEKGTLEIFLDGASVGSKGLSGVFSPEGLVDNAQLRLGCNGNITFEGKLDEIRLIQGLSTADEVLRMAHTTQNCAEDEGVFSISAVTPFYEGDTTYHNQPTTLATETYNINAFMGHDNMVTLDVTTLFHISTSLRISYTAKNCSANHIINVKSSESHNNPTGDGPKLILLRNCSTLLASTSRVLCDTCWNDTATFAECHDPSLYTTALIASRTTDTLDACKSTCSDSHTCASIQWDSTTGNCTAFSKDCTLTTTTTTTNRTNTIFLRKNESTSIATPSVLIFDSRDALLPTMAAAESAVLQLHLKTSTPLLQEGRCTLVVQNIVNNVAVRIAVGKLYAGSMVVVDATEVVVAEHPTIRLAVVLEDCANGTAVFCSGNDPSCSGPALHLHTNSFATHLSGRSKLNTHLTPAATQHLSFPLGPFVGRDVAVAYLTVPFGSTLCSTIEITVQNVFEKSTLKTTFVQNEGNIFDISSILRELRPSNGVVVVLSGGCVLMIEDTAKLQIILSRRSSLSGEVEQERNNACHVRGEHPDATPSASTLLIHLSDSSRIDLCSTVSIWSGSHRVIQPFYANTDELQISYANLGNSYKKSAENVILSVDVTGMHSDIFFALEPQNCGGHIFDEVVLNVTKAVLVNHYDNTVWSAGDCREGVANRVLRHLRVGGGAQCETLDDTAAVLSGSGGMYSDIYSTFHPQRFDDFSISFHFIAVDSTSANPTADGGFLFHKSPGLGIVGFGLKVSSDKTQLSLWTANSSTATATLPPAFLDRWHHFVVSRKDTQLSLYIDGVTVLQYTPADEELFWTGDATPLRFGASLSDGFASVVNGYYSDIKIIDHALEGSALQRWFDNSCVLRKYSKEILAVGSKTYVYEMSPQERGECTIAYQLWPGATQAECEHQCTQIHECLMFSLHLETKECRVHDVGESCLPQPRQNVVLFVKQQKLRHISTTGTRAVDALWMMWTETELLVGYGMSRRNVVLRVENLLSQHKRFALSQYSGGNSNSADRGQAWVFINPSAPQYHHITLASTALRSTEVSTRNHITLECRPDMHPLLPLPTEPFSIDIPYIRPSLCKGMTSGHGIYLYPCTEYIERDWSGNNNFQAFSGKSFEGGGGLARAVYFVVDGDSDVDIVLSEVAAVTECSDHRGVSITIDANTGSGRSTTTLRHGMCGKLIDSTQSDAITLGAPQWFWATYEDSIVSFGSGQIPHTNTIVSGPILHPLPVSYVHVGVKGSAPVSVAVYQKPRITFSKTALTVYPQRPASVELGLNIEIFNESRGVEVECDSAQNGYVQLNFLDGFTTFYAGDERGQRKPHILQVEFLRSGDCLLRCWVKGFPAPYFSYYWTLPISVATTDPPGSGFVNSFLSIPRWSTGYASLHFGSVRLPISEGSLLHVARPSIINDIRNNHAVMGYNATVGVVFENYVPAFSGEHCAMVFEKYHGFAVSVSDAFAAGTTLERAHTGGRLTSLSFAVTLLPSHTRCAEVVSQYAEQCCPIMSTGFFGSHMNSLPEYQQHGFEVNSAALSLCQSGDTKTLRFGVQTERTYHDVAHILNDTWVDILAVKDAVTDTLSLFVDGRLVDTHSKGGAVALGTALTTSEIVVAGGCFWRVRSDFTSSCPAASSSGLPSETSQASLQACVDYAKSFPGATAFSYFSPSTYTANCRIQNCTSQERDRFMQADPTGYSLGNVTGVLSSCSDHMFTGVVRRLRAWGRPVGYGDAFPMVDASIRNIERTTDCDLLVGDHSRLRGAAQANEPGEDTAVTCTVLDTDVARIADPSYQAFILPREAYGDVLRIPIEYVSSGRTSLRCEMARVHLNATSSILESSSALLSIYASPDPGWTKLPDMPAGLRGGPSLSVNGKIVVFAGNTVLQYENGVWSALGGSGVTFDGCACVHAARYKGVRHFLDAENKILVYGCPHGIVLTFDLETHRFERLERFVNIEGYQTASPMPTTNGAVIWDGGFHTTTAMFSGAFIGLQFDTRSAQRIRNPSEPNMDPMLARAVPALLHSAAGTDLYLLGQSASRANATRGSFTTNTILDPTARSLYERQSALGAFTLNLCGAVLSFGGLSAVKDAGLPFFDSYASEHTAWDAVDPSPTKGKETLLSHRENMVKSSRVVHVFSVDAANGDPLEEQAEFPPLRSGVLGGTAVASAGGLYHIGGIQSGLRKQSFADTQNNEFLCTDRANTSAAFVCAHPLNEAEGFAGTLIVGFKFLPNMNEFAVGLANSLCNATLAYPDTNDRLAWNPCNGYIRVVVTHTSLSVWQLQAGQDNLLTTQQITTLSTPLSHHRRYVWIAWGRRDGAWRLSVGRGVHPGANKVLAASPPLQTYLQTAAYYLTANSTADDYEFDVHSVVSDGLGSRTVQVLPDRAFPLSTCGGAGACDTSLGVCACYNPNKLGSSCERCLSNKEGALCEGYKACEELHPFQPHRQRECESWRARGCRSVAHDVDMWLPAMNQTVKRFWLNT